MGKQLIKPSNANKIDKALAKPKLLITTGDSKRTETMKKGPTKTTVTKNGITITGSATGTKNVPAKNLPKSTKMGNR